MTFTGEIVTKLTTPKDISCKLAICNDYLRQKDRELTNLWKAQAPKGQFQRKKLSGITTGQEAGHI